MLIAASYCKQLSDDATSSRLENRISILGMGRNFFSSKQHLDQVWGPPAHYPMGKIKVKWTATILLPTCTFKRQKYAKVQANFLLKLWRLSNLNVYIFLRKFKRE